MPFNKQTSLYCPANNRKLLWRDAHDVLGGGFRVRIILANTGPLGDSGALHYDTSVVGAAAKGRPGISALEKHVCPGRQGGRERGDGEGRGPGRGAQQRRASSGAWSPDGKLDLGSRDPRASTALS